MYVDVERFVPLSRKRTGLLVTTDHTPAFTCKIILINDHDHTMIKIEILALLPIYPDIHPHHVLTIAYSRVAIPTTTRFMHVISPL